MKRGILLVLSAGMLLSMVACGNKEDASSVSSESASSAVSVSLASSTASVSGSVPVPSSVAPQPVYMQGVFMALDENRYADENAPRFELFEDGTYTMKVNTGEGGEAGFTGSYSLLGNNLVLTVEERMGEDFLGQRIASLPFTKLSEDHFRYEGQPLGMTRAGDQFTRDGIPPMETPPPAPSQSASQSEGDYPADVPSGTLTAEPPASSRQ